MEASWFGFTVQAPSEARIHCLRFAEKPQTSSFLSFSEPEANLGVFFLNLQNILTHVYFHIKKGKEYFIVLLMFKEAFPDGQRKYVKLVSQRDG